jgi:type IV pilus assembly protein PilB
MISSGELVIETAVCQLITSEQAWHYRIIPKGESNTDQTFIISEKNSYKDLQDELELLFGKTTHRRNQDRRQGLSGRLD